MIKFINKHTGSYMYVDESREDEYIKAGHKPASNVIDFNKAETTIQNEIKKSSKSESSKSTEKKKLKSKKKGK